ncbi:MAG: hypothetical protein Q9223_004531 [Gallowayella weberi]
MEKLPSRSLRDRKTQLLVLLITPSYISLLDDQSSFIPELIRQTYGGLVKGRMLDVLVAVVDRISHPSSEITPAQAVTNNANKSMIGYTGDGISVMLADSETVAPGLWSQRENTDGKSSPITQRQSTLSFKFGANVEGGGRDERCSFRSKTIKLPVANTVFQNGRESTIQAQRWIVGEDILEPSLACIKRTWLKEQVLQMDFPCPHKPNKFPLHVGVPLKTLTGRKRVATSMGNVIRQVFAKNQPFPDEPQHNFQPEAEPASKDLESAVARLMSTPGSENEAVGIWALIRSPTSLERYYTPNASKVIKGGGHFHKVLSGGGGWGNRQGLLALDPEIDFDITPELRLTEDLEIEPPGEDRGRASGQIVNPGDIAEFFCLKWYGEFFRRPPKTPQAPTDPFGSWILSRLHPSGLKTRWPSFVFGTVSSTIDAMPVPHSPRGRASDPPPCIYVPKHFGMLSEQGISLTLVRRDGEVNRTKIDVPHAVVSCGTQDGRLHKRPLLYKQTSKRPNLIMHRVHSEDMSDGAAAPEPRSEYLVNNDTISGPKHQAEGLTLGKPIVETLGWRVLDRGIIASDEKSREPTRTRDTSYPAASKRDISFIRIAAKPTLVQRVKTFLIKKYISDRREKVASEKSSSIET